MVRILARLLGLLVGVSLVAGIASALAAIAYKKKAPPVPDPAADEIVLAVVMDGAKLASTATSFRGGRVISWYAGVDLDLRQATFDPAGARLEIRTVFGGTRVAVAPGIPVRVTGPAVFGGALNATGAAEPTPEAPGLEIAGCTLFGGLRVVAAERGEQVAPWVPDAGPAREPVPDAGPAPDPAPLPAPGPA
jgi:hypothetical protein